MKNTKSIIAGIILSAALLQSCERDITTLNVDPKHAAAVPSANLLASTQQVLFDQMVTPSVNYNVSRFFTQQWTETQYIDETNYNFVTRNQPQNHYNTLMRRVIQPLNEAKKQIQSESESAALSPADAAKVKANKLASVEIMSVFAWKNLVETFGNIPYSEALHSETGSEILQPKYDDAATVYADLVKRLDAAIGMINVSQAGYSSDLVYAGNMAKWKKAANSIKLEMGLMLSDVNPSTAKTLVESAVAGGVITSSADDFKLAYENGQFSNPVYQNLVASGRNDFIPSDVYVNNLKVKRDPRRFSQFAENKNASLGKVKSVETTTDKVTNITTTVVTFEEDIPAASIPKTENMVAIFKDLPAGTDSPANEEDLLIGYVNNASFGKNTVTIVSPRATVEKENTLNVENYVGGPYGNLASFTNYSHISTTVKQAAIPGYIIDAVQVKFELAEASARGFNVGGSAADLYAQAVLASMKQWGVADADATAYLAAHPYDAANWKKSIGEEAWVAMFNRGFEAWNFWRRLDYPVLTKPGNAESLVYRMPYSNNEYSTNKTNVEAAASAIGGDKYGTKLFFDKY